MEKQAASGLSVRAWCEREAVSFSAFRYWRQRLRQPWVDRPLTLLRLDAGAEVGGLWVAVGAARVEVRPGFDADLLRQVVAALSA